MNNIGEDEEPLGVALFSIFSTNTNSLFESACISVLSTLFEKKQSLAHSDDIFHKLMYFVHNFTIKAFDEK